MCIRLVRIRWPLRLRCSLSRIRQHRVATLGRRAIFALRIPLVSAPLTPLIVFIYRHYELRALVCYILRPIVHESQTRWLISSGGVSYAAGAAATVITSKVLGREESLVGVSERNDYETYAINVRRKTILNVLLNHCLVRVDELRVPHRRRAGYASSSHNL